MGIHYSKYFWLEVRVLHVAFSVPDKIAINIFIQVHDLWLDDKMCLNSETLRKYIHIPSYFYNTIYI